MTVRRKFEVAASLLLAAAQALGAASVKTSHKTIRSSPHIVARKTVKPFARQNYYAEIETAQQGPTVLIQTPADFDPNHRGTAASHIKLLSILATFREMDRNPDFETQIDAACDCTNWELVRRALISSDNTAAQILVSKIAPVSTNEGVADYLNNLAHEIGLSSKFHVKNASGDPDYPVRHGRADSYSTPSDEEIIGFELAKYKDRLRRVAWSVGTVPTDKPTNGLFYPSEVRGDPPDDGYVIVCKTGTDSAPPNPDGSMNAQNHSTLCILMGPDVVAEGYHRQAKFDPQSPIRFAANGLLRIMRQAKLENTRVESRLSDFGSGRLSGNNVGVSSNLIGKKRHYAFPSAPATEIRQAASVRHKPPHNRHREAALLAMRIR